MMSDILSSRNDEKQKSNPRLLLQNDFQGQLKKSTSRSDLKYSIFSQLCEHLKIGKKVYALNHFPSAPIAIMS